MIGDSGYTVSPVILTPIIGADPETPAGRYTQAHSSTRSTARRAFGHAKNVFRWINKERVLHYRPRKAAKIIIASVVLHNFGILNGSVLAIIIFVS